MSQAMPFSSDEQVKRSYEFLNSCKAPACPGCARGVRMCYHTPCIGTVDDIEKLLDAGYADKLMLDWWVGTGGRDTGKDNPFTDDVLYLIPAVLGSEGKQAKFARTGRCTLLVDNKCSLHDKGLKPVQGKLACCKIERVYLDENNQHTDLDERVPVLHTWNTQRGKDLIERWKKEVGFGQEKPSRKPENLGDLLDCLIGVFGAMDAMQSDKGKDGRPDIDFSQEIERELEVYEKPY